MPQLQSPISPPKLPGDAEARGLEIAEADMVLTPETIERVLLEWSRAQQR